ncbi:MAG: winged helix-turn-helix domain-containing protein [Candidatus Odinarchaeia archaeon]
MAVRSRLEILSEILKAVCSESIPTRIMYKVRITHYAFNDCMELLIAKSFIKEKNNLTTKKGINNRRRKKRYQITNKGIKLMGELKMLEELMCKKPISKKKMRMVSIKLRHSILDALSKNEYKIYLFMSIGVVSDWITTYYGIRYLGLVERNGVTNSLINFDMWLIINIFFGYVCMAIPFLIKRNYIKMGTFFLLIPLTLGIIKMMALLWNLSLIIRTSLL